MKLVLMQRLARPSMSIRQGTIRSHIYCSMINGHRVGSIMRDNTRITMATTVNGGRKYFGCCASSVGYRAYATLQSGNIQRSASLEKAL